MKSSKETTLRQTATSIDGANFKLTRTYCTFYLYHGDKRVAVHGGSICDYICMYMEGESLQSLRTMFNRLYAEYEQNTAAAVALSEHDIQRAKRMGATFVEDALDAKAICYVPGTRPAAVLTLAAAFAQA